LKLFLSEEFGIYLNYVRKLGFEEAPDYDFLRELFSKVIKSNGDVDDGVFDWNLLNGWFTPHPRFIPVILRYSLDGKGWEASLVRANLSYLLLTEC
jgi:casein kinase 1